VVEMNMKKVFTIIILLLSINHAYGLTDIPEFELLSPKEKVDTLLREYHGVTYIGGGNWDIILKIGRIFEQKDETAPYIFLLMREYDAHPYESGQNEIEILIGIVDAFFKFGVLNKYELDEVVKIYTKLLDKYLRTYKKIDTMAMFLEVDLIKFTNGIYSAVSLNWIEKMREKYIALGYENLTIDYEQLRRLSGLR
jgi:hypothetical protein